MSNYWFEEAEVNDLLRIEGPLGSFFLRKNEVENIIFIATGTGVAPIKAILENLNQSTEKISNRKYWIFVGARYEKDLFWNPIDLDFITNLYYVPVLSRGSEDWKGERGYVQDIIIKHNIPLANAQVYACGSNTMIRAAKRTLVEKGLDKKQFFSDAFVETN